MWTDVSQRPFTNIKRLMNQTERRLKIATDLLSRFSTEGAAFPSKLWQFKQPTCLRSYSPEMRRQTLVWHTPNSPRPIKFREVQSK